MTSYIDEQMRAQHELENRTTNIKERRCNCGGWSLDSRKDGKCSACAEAYETYIKNNQKGDR